MACRGLLLYGLFSGVACQLGEALRSASVEACKISHGQQRADSTRLVDESSNHCYSHDEVYKISTQRRRADSTRLVEENRNEVCKLSEQVSSAESQGSCLLL
eukprot:365264-Chlamydomonas_euryale.AAC.1